MLILSICKNQQLSKNILLKLNSSIHKVNTKCYNTKLDRSKWSLFSFRLNLGPKNVFKFRNTRNFAPPRASNENSANLKYKMSKQSSFCNRS